MTDKLFENNQVSMMERLCQNSATAMRFLEKGFIW